MPSYIVEGGVPLCGVIHVQGAKNSVLPILAATLIADGECRIGNCPEISDTYTAAEILRGLGATVTLFSDKIYVDATSAAGFVISEELMRKMRSSVVFLGAILARRHHAVVSFPGGCELGPRPIDMHLSALRKMGVVIREEHGYLDCECDRLIGSDISLAIPSVGATENIMLAAVTAEGRTVINNAAREPEICDLQDFLNKMGAKVRGAGTPTVVIDGVKKLHGAEHRVIPDRIAATTYMCAVAATRGNALLHDTAPEHLSGIISFMREAGCTINVDGSDIYISCDRLHACRPVRTMPYPGFPTDAQAVCMAMMCRAKGSSVFIETVFSDRFRHVGELLRMGAKITVDGRVAIVDGVEKMYGANVDSTDLRGAAALVVAALAADGESEIRKIEHIERGYDCMPKVLSELGAKIVRRD